MESYRLLIFPTAKHDLEEIVDYLNDLSHQAALNTYDDIVEKIATLVHMPYRCPLVKDRTLKNRGYRVLVADNYLVFYVINDNAVEIRRILHGRRKFEFLL